MYKSSFYPKQHKKIKGVIFSLKGLIVDRYANLTIKSLGCSLDKHGILVPRETLRDLVSNDSYSTIYSLLKTDEIYKKIFSKNSSDTSKVFDLIVKSVDTSLRENIEELSKPLEDVKFIFDYLEYHKIKTGIISTLPEEITHDIILNLNDQKIIPDAYFSNDCSYGSIEKPYPVWRCMEDLRIPNPQQIVRVCSSIGDIINTKYSGCNSVGIAYNSPCIDYQNDSELETKGVNASLTMISSGSHYITNNLSKFPLILSYINKYINMDKI